MSNTIRPGQTANIDHIQALWLESATPSAGPHAGLGTPVPTAWEPITLITVHRTIVAVDIEGFGDHRRNNINQVRVRHGLYGAMRQAFEAVDIPWNSSYREDNTVAEPAVHAWLSTAVARPDWRDPVLDILTEGAKAPEAHPDRVGNLMMCANRWYDATRRNWPASEDDPQADVYRDLQARLTRVEATPGERIGTGDG